MTTSSYFRMTQGPPKSLEELLKEPDEDKICKGCGKSFTENWIIHHKEFNKHQDFPNKYCSGECYRKNYYSKLPKSRQGNLKNSRIYMRVPSILKREFPQLYKYCRAKAKEELGL